jgi:phage replication initiation protein
MFKPKAPVQAVICDHLAFTVPLANFQHLERAGSSTHHFWQKMPVKTWNKSTNETQKHLLMDLYNHDCAEILFKRMTEFVFHVMGLKVSVSSRDKGLHGYKDSHRIMDETGRVELGFVGIGGNQNTVYIQISGEGCKHVFGKVTPFVLHFWLSKVLTVTRLARLDLAYDCFEGVFTCKYAADAYHDGCFQNARGGPYPKSQSRIDYASDELIGELFGVGSRKCQVFWRIYDKAKEQGIFDQDWCRSEVELKKIPVDALIDLNATFTGLNGFSASFNLGEGVAFRSSVKRARLGLSGRIRWAKRQCGRTVSDLVELFGGDVNLAFGAICDERGGKFSLPDTQSILINEHIHTHMIVLKPTRLACSVDLIVRDMKIKSADTVDYLYPTAHVYPQYSQIPKEGK